MATSGLPLLNNVLWTLGLDLEHPHPDTTANRTGAPRSRTAKENRDRVKKRVGKMMKKVRSSAGLKGLGREKKGEEKNKLRGARSFANLKGLEGLGSRPATPATASFPASVHEQQAEDTPPVPALPNTSVAEQLTLDRRPHQLLTAHPSKDAIMAATQESILQTNNAATPFGTPIYEDFKKKSIFSAEPEQQIRVGELNVAISQISGQLPGRIVYKNHKRKDSAIKGSRRPSGLPRRTTGDHSARRPVDTANASGTSLSSLPLGPRIPTRAGLPSPPMSTHPAMRPGLGVVGDGEMRSMPVRSWTEPVPTLPNVQLRGSNTFPSMQNDPAAGSFGDGQDFTENRKSLGGAQGNVLMIRTEPSRNSIRASTTSTYPEELFTADDEAQTEQTKRRMAKLERLFGSEVLGAPLLHSQTSTHSIQVTRTDKQAVEKQKLDKQQQKDLKKRAKIREQADKHLSIVCEGSVLDLPAAMAKMPLDAKAKTLPLLPSENGASTHAKESEQAIRAGLIRSGSEPVLPAAVLVQSDTAHYGQDLEHARHGSAPSYIPLSAFSPGSRATQPSSLLLADTALEGAHLAMFPGSCMSSQSTQVYTRTKTQSSSPVSMAVIDQQSSHMAKSNADMPSSAAAGLTNPNMVSSGDEGMNLHQEGAYLAGLSAPIRRSQSPPPLPRKSSSRAQKVRCPVVIGGAPHALAYEHVVQFPGEDADDIAGDDCRRASSRSPVSALSASSSVKHDSNFFLDHGNDGLQNRLHAQVRPDIAIADEPVAVNPRTCVDESKSPDTAPQDVADHLMRPPEDRDHREPVKVRNFSRKCTVEFDDIRARAHRHGQDSTPARQSVQSLSVYSDNGEDHDPHEELCENADAKRDSINKVSIAADYSAPASASTRSNKPSYSQSKAMVNTHNSTPAHELRHKTPAMRSTVSLRAMIEQKVYKTRPEQEPNDTKHALPPKRVDSGHESPKTTLPTDSGNSLFAYRPMGNPPWVPELK